MKKSIIIFGASNHGEIVYRNIHEKYNVIGFCDNDPKKRGAILFGKRIYSPEELIELVKKTKIKIVIASSFYLEIVEQLSSMGVVFVYVSFIKIKRDLITGETRNEIILNSYNVKDFKRNDKVANRIGLIVRNNSGSNTLALQKNMPQRIKEKYEILVIYDNEDKLEYYKKISTCEIVVTTHTNINFRGLDDRIYIQLWHGFPMKAMGRLDRNDSKEKKQIQESWNIFDKIGSYSSLYSSLTSGCFGGIISNHEIVGAPRNDYLFTSKGRENLSELFNMDLSKKRIIYYTPTFRLNKYHHEVSGNKNWNNFFGFPQFDLNEFSQYLEENDIFLVLKMHPYEEDYTKDILEKYKINNIVLLLDKTLSELDFYETLNACDLLITDYSSIYYDYLLLDRPIIFTPVDLEDYIENTGMLYGPYDFWTPGDKAYNQEELQEHILMNFSHVDKYKKERETIRNIVHHFNDDNSCERVWKLIEDIYELNYYKKKEKELIKN